jgi:hypothetical protein
MLPSPRACKNCARFNDGVSLTGDSTAFSSSCTLSLSRDRLAAGEKKRASACAVLQSLHMLHHVQTTFQLRCILQRFATLSLLVPTLRHLFYSSSQLVWFASTVTHGGLA